MKVAIIKHAPIATSKYIKVLSSASANATAKSNPATAAIHRKIKTNEIFLHVETDFLCTCYLYANSFSMEMAMKVTMISTTPDM